MRVLLLTSGFFLLACSGLFDKSDDEDEDTGDERTFDGDADVDADADADADTDTTEELDVDNDGDGYTENEGDCDDHTERVNPDARDECDNGRDEDCNGRVDDGPGCDETTSGSDTGPAFAYWTGGIETSRGSFVSGRFGWSYYGLQMGDWVCVAEGEMEYEGRGADGCPDCTWAFNLSAIQNSTAEGDYCQSGNIQWSDGDLDGYIDYDWGFAETYEYDYDGNILVFETNVLLYSTDGWFVFAFSLPDYGIYQTYGDAESVQFYRMITSSSGDPYYYYYYP
ncbi:MAG: putative metal-binding motif-containing protein [Myxococcota bacterium]